MQGKEQEGIKFNRTDLAAHQSDSNYLGDLKAELDLKKKEFETANHELIRKIKLLSEAVYDEQSQIKVLVIAEFDKDPEPDLSKRNKKFLGGLSVKVGADLIYKQEDALAWAKEKMPVAIKTVLDTKLFEPFAKLNELDFVKKKEKVTVCFPSKGISFEEDG